MAFRRLTDEQLRKLTAEERIKYLRALEAERKREAEEAKRKADEDIAAAERLIEESESEEEQEEQDLKRRQERKEEPVKEEESLEDRLAKERAASAADGGQYRTDKPYEQPGQARDGANPLYRSLETAASDLDRLYRTSEWSREDEERYRAAKEQVERAATYQLQSDRLREELGVARDFLERLHYKR